MWLLPFFCSINYFLISELSLFLRIKIRLVTIQKTIVICLIKRKVWFVLDRVE